jgi:predicted nucleotidyltransferase
MTKDDIIKKLAQDKPMLQKQFKVRKIALFGSWARGDQRPESDIDILVDVDPSIGLEFVCLAEKLEQILHKPVDLISSRSVSPKFGKYIEQELIYV